MNQDELNKILENHNHWMNEDCDDWGRMKADLEGDNLSGLNLNFVDLSYADLSKTNLNGANFRYAICDVISIGNIGSRRDTTYYFYNDDRVICGCFDGTMNEFKNKIKASYDKNDKHYGEYMLAVEYLEKMAKLEESFD